MTDHGRGDGDALIARLLTDEIGSGPKSAGDMTYGEARLAFDAVLDRTVDPVRLGAFWLANRWKRNTPDELAGFVDAMHDRLPDGVPARPTVDGPIVDCGANYDGKVETPVYGVAAGLVAASAGANVAVHSADAVPATGGATYRDVLDGLGVPTDIGPRASRRMLEETGFGFYRQRHCNPDVHGVLEQRERFGLRTFVNTVETLLDPADADVHLGSFYHLPFARKVVETVDRSERLGFDRVVMMQGLEGYDDVRPGSTVVATRDGDRLDDREVATADHGLGADREDLSVDDVPATSARLTEEVLAGERTDAHRDAVVLNAAIRLHAAGVADDLDDAVASSRAALDGGEPLRRLGRLRERARAAER